MLDVLVVGAGSAGAMAAWQCARRGMSVRCVDARSLDVAGARWVNGVSEAALRDLGIERPDPPHALVGDTMHMIAGWGPERISVSDTGLLELDMRWLVRELQGRAVQAGAQLGVGRVGNVEQYDDFVEVTIGEQKVRTRFMIDAAGLRGPTALRVHRRDLCVAAQEERQLVDPGAAHEWLVDRAVRPGEVSSHTGVAGGYSIVNVSVHLPDDDGPGRVSLLTGSMPAYGHAAGTVLLRRFVQDNQWIGPKISGGSRAIPVGLPPVRLDVGRVARVGDSAGQVYAMHGSGTVPGMVAATLLAQILDDGGSPWEYTVAWQRQHGPSMASAAVFQAHSRTLSTQDLRSLIRAGLMHSELVRAGLQQQRPSMSPGLLLTLASRVLRAPRAGARLLPVVKRMGAAERLWSAYPAEKAALSAWSDRRRALLG
ncbi:MAG: flavin-dependent dehydrogenase [Kiritimatiellia bacterium]|jgi:flavin-dependent dehydrogenase